jgi:diguanylate cyclase (GGDEF)-like protein
VLREGEDLARGLQVAERLRRLVEAAPVAHEGQQIACTVSIGVASSEARRHDMAALLDSADQALYEAKQRGRNQVVGR